MRFRMPLRCTDVFLPYWLSLTMHCNRLVSCPRPYFSGIGSGNIRTSQVVPAEFTLRKASFIGASLSEPHLVRTMISLSVYILKNEQKSRDAAAKKYRYKRSRDK